MSQKEIYFGVVFISSSYMFCYAGFVIFGKHLQKNNKIKKHITEEMKPTQCFFMTYT